MPIMDDFGNIEYFDPDVTIVGPDGLPILIAGGEGSASSSYLRSEWQRGLSNGDFAEGPPDPTKPINSDGNDAEFNPLPGWGLVDDSNGSMKLYWEVEPLSGSGGRLHCVAAAGSLDTETLRLRQFAPFPVSIAQLASIVSQVTGYNGFSTPTDSLRLGFEGTYYKSDETTVTGADPWDTASRTWDNFSDPATVVSGSAAGAPADAGWYLFAIKFSRDTGQAAAAGNVYVAEAALIHSVSEAVFHDTSDPTFSASRIRQSAGALGFYGPAGTGQMSISDNGVDISSLLLPRSAAPAQTAEGSAVWDSDDDKLTIGDGAAALSFYPARTGTFTPALRFATVGTSTWAPTIQVGRYVKLTNNLVWITFTYAGVPTNGTGAGNLELTGLPFTVLNVADNSTSGIPCMIGGWTKAGFSWVQFTPSTNTTTGRFQAGGSGVAASPLTVADIPSGGTVSVRASGLFEI